MLSKLITVTPKNRLLLCAAATSALTALGCASEELEQEGDAQEAEELALVAPINQQATTPNPDLPFFASVTANGSGCPRGTWTTYLSDDGLTFTTSFDEYVARVSDGVRTSFKDCNLTIKLKSPSGLSYAVSDFVYQGYVNLEEGVKAFQTANYYFQGNPIPSVDKEKRTDLTGPVSRPYYFKDTVTTVDAVWSPCGLDRNLNVVTRLGLQKSQNVGEGEINVLNVDGQVEGKVILKLAWRKCGTTASTGGATTGGSTTGGSTTGGSTTGGSTTGGSTTGGTVTSGGNNTGSSNNGGNNNGGGRNNGGRNNGGNNGGRNGRR